MSKTKTVELLVTVRTPKRMPLRQTADLIAQCIEVGMADAADTVDDPDLVNPAANDVTNLEVVDVKPFTVRAK